MSMGRGSDTRIYAPRSESTNLLSSSNEDETKYNPTSPEDNDKRAEEKKLKDEHEKQKGDDIKHIKIKPSQGLGEGPKLPTEPGLDDGDKRDDEREIGLQGGPAGSRGHLLDLATGAKSGTGSSMNTGVPIAMSEPMADAWSSLLKASLEDLIAERDRLSQSGLRQEAKQFDAVINQMQRPQQQEERLLQNTAMPTAQMVMPELEGDELRDMAQNMMIEGRENPDYKEMQRNMGGYGPDIRKPFMRNVSRMANRMPQIEEGNLHAQQSLRDLQERDPSQYFADEAMMATGEPMDDAWSEILKEMPIGYSAVGPSSRCDNTQEGCDGTYEAHYRGPQDNPKGLVDIFCPKCGRYHEITGDEYDRYLQTDMARGEHPSQQNIQTGEPMDIAMRLLKMPLVPNSIKQIATYNDGGPDPIDDYTAEYKHPETGEIYPMFGTVRPDLGRGGGSEVRIGGKGNAHDTGFNYDENRYANEMYRDDGHWDGKTITPRYAHLKDAPLTPLSADVHTAMNDLAASMYDKYGVKVIPPTYGESMMETGYKPKSDLEEEIWADKEHWPVPVQTGEPMDGAWSTLLKRDTPALMEGRRRHEKRQEFRPSTGQFNRPPGGQTPAGATMRRFRAHMRGIKGGKKTGLMKPHLSVEMSHRGIATKQPMSKDPQRYGQYMGQQEARKILGNVRTTYSPHARHSARSFTAGPTGGGRLTGLLPGQSGQMGQPSLRPMRQPRMPRIRQPRMPGLTPPPPMAPPMSSVPSMPSMAPPPPPQMMMSDERTASDLLKSNRHANRTEMLALMRMLIQAQRAKSSMKKAKANFYDGAVPAHPSPVHQHEDEDEKNDGPTQNLETNSSRLGLDPAGYLSSKTGHMG